VRIEPQRPNEVLPTFAECPSELLRGHRRPGARARVDRDVGYRCCTEATVFRTAFDPEHRAVTVFGGQREQKPSPRHQCIEPRRHGMGGTRIHHHDIRRTWIERCSVSRDDLDVCDV
jgi:hypothetical protein